MTDVSKLQGVWRTNGHNKIFVITSDDFKIFDISKISCVLAYTDTLETFEQLFDRFELESHNQFSMYTRWGITKYTLVKQKSLLDVYGQLNKADEVNPEYNFEVFWQYFAENYAFFEQRGVDWEEVYRTYRLMVTQKTTNAKLVDVISKAIHTLNDPQITLEVDGQQAITMKSHPLGSHWQREFNSTAFPDLYPKGIPSLYKAVHSHILLGLSKSALNHQMIWGKIRPYIGYLNVFALMDMFADVDLHRHGGFEAVNNEYLIAVRNVMSVIMDDFRDMKAVILDLRFTSGGHEAASVIIANHFADQDRLAYIKKAVSGNDFTEPQEVYIRPEGEFQFSGPIALLTSEVTANAAEIFIHCMMARPHVVRVGNKTSGMVSHMLQKQLPNGWKIRLPNEVYQTANGNVYQGIGILPDLEEPVFYNRDFHNFYPGLRFTVEEAISHLRAKLF
ncbi:MAG: S41 family peptidase [Anaerolineaceae bacterium]|nr:S41 family peptidase [Anaerolineaceae bacterium]